MYKFQGRCFIIPRLEFIPSRRTNGNYKVCRPFGDQNTCKNFNPGKEEKALKPKRGGQKDKLSHRLTFIRLQAGARKTQLFSFQKLGDKMART